MTTISERQFAAAVVEAVAEVDLSSVGYVTGPGRSGAVAAVYVSYVTGLPFVPFGCHGSGLALIVDTVSQSGRTITKASKRYEFSKTLVVMGRKSRRLHFWYERIKDGSE